MPSKRRTGIFLVAVAVIAALAGATLFIREMLQEEPDSDRREAVKGKGIVNPKGNTGTQSPGLVLKEQIRSSSVEILAPVIPPNRENKNPENWASPVDPARIISYSENQIYPRESVAKLAAYLDLALPPSSHDFGRDGFKLDPDEAVIFYDELIAEVYREHQGSFGDPRWFHQGKYEKSVSSHPTPIQKLLFNEGTKIIHFAPKGFPGLPSGNVPDYWLEVNTINGHARLQIRVID